MAVIGMNKERMTEYIRFCADRLLVALNCPKYYNVTNPFEWMTLISLQGKTNFFEKRVTEYSKAKVGVAEDSTPKEEVFDHLMDDMDFDF